MVAHYLATGGHHPAANDAGATDEWAPRTRRSARELTHGQITAVHMVMRLFVEDDFARGVLPSQTAFCPACDAARPLAGFIRYDGGAANAFVCNTCATEYEVARMQGSVSCIGEYVRTKAGRGADIAPIMRGTAIGQRPRLSRKRPTSTRCVRVDGTTEAVARP